MGAKKTTAMVCVCSPRRLLLLLLLLLLLARRARAGFWSGGDAAAAVAVEVDAAGDAAAAGDADAAGDAAAAPPAAPRTAPAAACRPALPPLPGKYVGPLGDAKTPAGGGGGGGGGAGLEIVAAQGSPTWCGAAGGPTAGGHAGAAVRRHRGAFPGGVFLANAGSAAVRSAFGIAARAQLPAAASVDRATGRRYVLRNGEAADTLGQGYSLARTPLDDLVRVLAKGKPLDIFDVAWWRANSPGAHAYAQEQDVPVVYVAVANTQGAKKLVQEGLRKVAQARRGVARVLLVKDPGSWAQLGLGRDPARIDFPYAVVDRRRHHRRAHHGPLGRRGAAAAVGEIVDRVAAERTHTAARDLRGRNFTGGRFHRVSWSPHLYAMDGFLSPDECRKMVANAYPTLSTGSLVGDNIDKRIKDLRFTVVPENKITHVEQGVIDRIHDHIRVSEDHGEILQVSEYLPGQKYTIHPDSIDSSPGRHSMQRIMTVLIYLNDVEAGGETIFPRGNGQNQHMTRHDTEPWNLQHFCGQEDALKIEPRAGRAIFWYNHHTDLSWDQNTIHGACHVKRGKKYVAQRWIRWHTSQTLGNNPYQNALDEGSRLRYQLNEQREINRASGGDQAQQLMQQVQATEAQARGLQQQLDEARRKAQDLRERLRYLGDDIPLSVRPGWMAAVWSDWVTAKSMFVPALNNQDGVDGVSRKICAVMLGLRARDEPDEVERCVVCCCVWCRVNGVSGFRLCRRFWLTHTHTHTHTPRRARTGAPCCRTNCSPGRRSASRISSAPTRAGFRRPSSGPSRGRRTGGWSRCTTASPPPRRGWWRATTTTTTTTTTRGQRASRTRTRNGASACTRWARFMSSWSGRCACTTSP